ncbi:MAG: TetR/AcrR family transcriptional regulator [Desulfobacter sp.]|nr:TetR/AcrR family transcriptional regulator [Desulfobacter sp.]WDP85405.1 MAG: TetR/AcrR family transcriptional regulator [Desulfobacter sp.]
MEKISTLTKLKQEDRELRKNLIIDAAQKIFGSKTYDRASMREIAKEAGMAVSSIYTYFENQETLFVQAILRETNQLLDEMDIMVSEEIDIDIEKLMNRYLDFYIDHENHWRMITHFFLFGNISPEASKSLNNVARRILNIFDIIFTKMNYEGDVRLLSHAFFSCLSGILISFRKYPGRTDDEIRAHMKRVGGIIRGMLLPYIQTGISTPEAHQS